MKIDDVRQRSDVEGLGGTHFPALTNKNHAEVCALAHAAPYHVDVPGLENSQRQRAAREQHDIQWKQRDHCLNHCRARSAASSLSCNPPKPPLLITRMWSPGRLSAASPVTNSSTLGANSARSPKPDTAPGRSQPRSGEFKNQVWSANPSAGASCSRCTPSFIVFERASSTAMMRAAPTRARSP